MFKGHIREWTKKDRQKRYENDVLEAEGAIDWLDEPPELDMYGGEVEDSGDSDTPAVVRVWSQEELWSFGLDHLDADSCRADNRDDGEGWRTSWTSDNLGTEENRIFACLRHG